MKSTKQTSDSAQAQGASGTKVLGLTPRGSGYAGNSPATQNPSGSSQTSSRGKQGRG